MHHIPRVKLIINLKTQKAFWFGSWSYRLLLPILRIQVASERKRLLFSRLDQWCTRENYALIRRPATESDLLEGAESSAKPKTEPELEVSIHKHHDVSGFPKSFIDKFDFEVITSEKKVDALEVQVAIGYASPIKWVNLDLREYQTTEVDSGKSGEPTKRLSLLSHDSKRFTLITFFFDAKEGIDRTVTIKTSDPTEQEELDRMRFSFPPTIYVRFAGLEKELERRYIVVFNKPPWGDPSKSRLV